MDREAFPTLTAGDTGWPVMTVPWVGRADVTVEVYEDAEAGIIPVISIEAPGSKWPVRVFVNGTEVTPA